MPPGNKRRSSIWQWLKSFLPLRSRLSFVKITGRGTMMHEEQVSHYIEEVRDRFPNCKLEFSTQTFNTYTELWVYVLEMGAYEEVEAFCNDLMAREPAKEHPIWVFART